MTVYAHGLEPQDFHAVFEVHLGDRWVVMDGTRKVPLNGLVRIATGRDAGGVAMATLFGHVVGLQSLRRRTTPRPPQPTSPILISSLPASQALWEIDS